MATATSERLTAAAALVAAAVLAGCGASSGAPHAWPAASLPGGLARLAYPPGWHAARTDPGTVTYVRTDARGRIAGYLNATPRQGPETLANWARFRPAHNADEGDRHVVRHSATTGVPFHGGRGSCVDDSYQTSVTSYRELACLVAGRHGSSVVVAAAPLARWSSERPALLRALASYAVR